MTARPTADAADLVPGEAPADATYDRDFYSWSLEQARLVREGRLDALDRDNVAEELESLGREQFNKLESALRVLLVHMLKWDHQPARRGRSWALSIKEQRAVLAIARAYRLARIGAAKETGLDDDTFPPACPYSFDAIVSRVFAPDS